MNVFVSSRCVRLDNSSFLQAQQLQQEERSNLTPHAPTTGAPPDVPMVVQELGPNERVAPSERQSAEVTNQIAPCPHTLRYEAN